jgi:hypothetical protein
LVRNAFPPEQPANDFFPTAEAHDRIIRITLNNLSDAETVERVRDAVDVGVREIFVEIDPLLRVFRSGEVPAYFRMVRDFSDRLRGAAIHTLGLGPAVANDGISSDSLGEGTYNGNTDALALDYPVFVRAPRDPTAIAEALAIARRQGLDIVWVAMPRSQTAAAYLGPAFETAFAGRLQEFAANFGARIWRPTKSWPDAFFVDQAHLNAAGRARFMSELRRYGATAR